MIAAFFLTTSFAKLETPQLRDVLRYYASTARRIVPCAMLVITGTILAGMVFAPSMLWRETIYNAAASTLFIENWWLAWTGTDYLRQGLSVSPFQQMWALSLQVQYYLVLPLVLWAIARLARTMGYPQRKAWTLALLAILVCSLAYSIVITDRNQPWAYFDSFARGWEYMIGALLALNIDRIPTANRTVLRILGYLCLVALVGFAAVMPVSKLFPGYAALVPVLATAGLIVTARAGADIAPLRIKPLLALADISFAFYLWHWPLLIYWRMQTGSFEVGLVAGLGIIALAGVLAFVSVRLFETPFRRWKLLAPRPIVALLASALLMTPAVAAVAQWRAVLDRQEATARQALAAFRAAPGPVPQAAGPLPDPIIARQDIPVAYGDGCHQGLTQDTVLECIYGKETGRTEVALVGGSHSLQWLPALQSLAGQMDLRIINMTKSGCTFTDDALADPTLLYPRICDRWNAAAARRIIEIDPDLVITIATRGRGPDEIIPEQYPAIWDDLTVQGIPILALRDNPWFGYDVVECVDRAEAPQDCDRDRDTVLNEADPGGALSMPLVTYADLSDLYCTATTCPAVDQGLLVYRDTHHLTASYVLAHADALAAQIDRALNGR
ncbi:acyltransferase family protein [Pseudoroseicyclus aestuarii]|uniref:Peptidoglycan/LPS O-acetylase OafA/YrhL n=1 Tax=Pseudoroseicyclus aestuarii TaxID=1795041 RepID=A0A318SN23_9RHOB|nr:acyltransferase family protein [Pseudoroseicyclus aestuarii]PYE82234.1 peptidoglycan/LPS O-acetylase OafA/YrhL [Pseudoroseicyclus aestuarii]